MKTNFLARARKNKPKPKTGLISCSRDDCNSIIDSSDGDICIVCLYTESREFPPEKGFNNCPNPELDYSKKD